MNENIAPLQDNRVHYFGQFIAVVVAETYKQARAAANLVKVYYAKQPHPIDLKTGECSGVIALPRRWIRFQRRTVGQWHAGSDGSQSYLKAGEADGNAANDAN